MAHQIRVEPEALRQSARDIEQIINENDDINSRIRNFAGKLEESWDGTASKFVVEKLQELTQFSNSAKEELEGSALFLQAVAQAFESIDEGEDSTIRGRSIPFGADEKIGKSLVGSGERWTIDPFPLFSGYIRVIPDGLREVANESKSVIEVTNEISNRIGEILSKLQNSWEGRAYNKFSDRFDQIKKYYIQLSEALGEFSQRILSVANRYEEIDNMFI